jgi:hypothetical protein
MAKFRRALIVVIAALPLSVAAGSTPATASGPSLRNAGAVYVGAEEGIPANERYPEGSTAF